MPLLPAVVPAIPENRTEIAAARLARKIAPLFGVPWPEGPFGGRTWVCDYAKITLSEIARGAPLPTREQATRIDQPAKGRWAVIDRIGMTGSEATLPNEIANATLNRFGPDTRAAVVLTAVNRLLAPVRESVDCALALLRDGRAAPLPGRLRLAAWAGLVIETFRSQPALVAAGAHARAIQLELARPWRLPLAVALGDLPLTRCEVSPAEIPRSSASAPRTLEVADATFAALRLDESAPDPEHPDLGAEPAELAGRLRRHECVDLLLRRLLAAGTDAEPSYLWMSERQQGQLAVEALMPSTVVIDRFVRDTWRLLGVAEYAHEPPLVLPAVPPRHELEELPVMTRRAVLIGLLTVLRHIQNSPSGRDATRREVVPVLAGVADHARTVLDHDDPVAALTQCRVADMMVQTLRPDDRMALRGPVRDLLAGLDRCEDLLRRGILDRGAAAEAISSACVELNAVARNNATSPDLPDRVELRDRVRRSWDVYHDALEIRPFGEDLNAPRPPRLACYHLQNYAAFLAGSTAPAEQERAVELFRELVIPAREQFFALSDHFLPLRHSLQVASRATTRLAEAARERGDTEAAIRWATLGHSWITRALAARDTGRLLAAEPPTESACRFALLAAPALLVAVELAVPGTEDDTDRAATLIDLVRRWETNAMGGGEYHSRNDEVVRLTARLAAVRSTDQPGATPLGDGRARD